MHREMQAGDSRKGLPYWQINVSEGERLDECPDFLAVISDKDRGIISTPDSEYRRDTWAEVRQKVRQNRIDLFKRVPSELRRYLAYSWQLRKEDGSVMNFILTQRLHWTQPLLARGKPFQAADDIRILWNDWPCELLEWQKQRRYGLPESLLPMG